MHPSRRRPRADPEDVPLGYEAATPHLTLAAPPVPRAPSSSPAKPPMARSVRGVLVAAFAMLASTA